MVKEAQENEAADKAKKEAVDTKNEAEQILFSVRKSVEDLGSEVTEQEKTDIEAKSKELEEALKGDNIEDIKAKKEELLKVSQNVAMRAYQKAQQAQQASQGTTDNNSNNNPDDVVDADFTEEK